jgi:MoaA/NifB/PqqE/SkfB family radical SAM enzyme
MCARNIQGGVVNPFINLTEIKLDVFKKWFSPDIIKQLHRLYMCGNLGDPIVAKDTLEIFHYLRKINPNISLSMNTNGSARSTEWWESLAKLNVTVRFGIDGLEDTHCLYRIGTDFDKIINNATSFIQAGGYAVWDMLVFQHNLHQVNECRQLSVNLGFKEFHSKNTARFNEGEFRVLNVEGKTVNILYPTDRSKEIKQKTYNRIEIIEESKTIQCKVKEEKSIYVSATGTVTPCCWLDKEGMPLHNISRIDYMDTIGKYYNLYENSLDEIFNSSLFTSIENSWNGRPLKECSKQCGQIDRFGEQFK